MTRYQTIVLLCGILPILIIWGITRWDIERRRPRD